MPTYEYKCDACEHLFERFQSIMAAPIKRCPECGKAKVRRLISTGGGMIFKGSGFYITDYRDKSYTDKAKAESGTPSESKSDESKPNESKSNESKSDAKTETKSETKSEKTPAPKTESKPAQKVSKKESKAKKSE